MNVALTRAKHGLIVIGNPEVLTTDDYWTAFLAFCHRNGLWLDQQGVGSVKLGSEIMERMEREPQVGALERALVNREERGHHIRGVALGKRHIDADEDMWTAGLTAALALEESGLYEGGDNLVGEDLDAREEGEEEEEEEEEEGEEEKEEKKS